MAPGEALSAVESTKAKTIEASRTLWPSAQHSGGTVTSAAGILPSVLKASVNSPGSVCDPGESVPSTCARATGGSGGGESGVGRRSQGWTDGDNDAGSQVEANEPRRGRKTSG